MSDKKLIDVSTACEYLGVMPRTLTKYRSLGMPRHGHGLYEPAAIIAWFVAFEIKKRANFEKLGKGRRKTPEQVANDPGNRLLEARALKLETENLVEDRKLLLVTDVEALVSSMATTFASALDSLGPRLAPILAGMEEPAEIQAEIRKESHITRKLVADKMRAFGLEGSK